MTTRIELTPLIPPMRWLLYIAAVLVFLAGVELFVFPLRTADWFAWTVNPPMTAVFLGASYWASAVLEVAGARSASWDRAQLAVWPVFVFTTLILGVTLLHLDRFHVGGEFPPLAHLATWIWLGIYAFVPVAMLVLSWVQTRVRRPAAEVVTIVRLPLPPGLRVLLVAIAIVLMVLGVALLVAPLSAAVLWPWELTELTGRAVGAWLVGLGWAAGQGQLSGDADAVRPVGLTAVAFFVLQVIALLRHGEAISWTSPQAIGYAVMLLAIGAAGVWALGLVRSRVVEPDPAAREGRATAT
ncbi:hypothetical protein GCM10022261_20610 [Brevibacterium daeguense]|uniref:Uncharacterized protein n=1 Tax=Brevibacterium daeguense TaxID=909936 RepID=A0ABP8EKU9_9MICO|nr:hypothetical protein [Brevibacterium daeguense]